MAGLVRQPAAEYAAHTGNQLAAVWAGIIRLGRAAILKAREVQEPAFTQSVAIMHRVCRLGGLFE